MGYISYFFVRSYIKYKCSISLVVLFPLSIIQNYLSYLQTFLFHRSGLLRAI